MRCAVSAILRCDSPEQRDDRETFYTVQAHGIEARAVRRQRAQQFQFADSATANLHHVERRQEEIALPDWWRDILPTVALLISAAALAFNAWSLRSGAKSKDLDWLFRYLADMRAMEAKLLTADTDATRDSAFVEFVNFLEVCCYAHNTRLFPRLTRVMVTDNLVNAVASIEASPHAARFSGLLTSPQTFESLAKFTRRHRRMIDGVRSALPPIESGT